MVSWQGATFAEMESVFLADSASYSRSELAKRDPVTPECAVRTRSSIRVTYSCKEKTWRYNHTVARTTTMFVSSR